jgi:hypothetical protein
MPAKRLPSQIAKITGATAKNPQRYRDRANPAVEPLGPAPKSYDDEQREIWDNFNLNFPWLARSDRHLVRVAVDLQMMIDSGTAPIAAYAQMRLVLASMGGTPCDRSRVSAPNDDGDDPSSEFFN